MLQPWQVLLCVLAIILLLFVIGAWGHHTILGTSWTDGWYLSALTMAGLSLETKPTTTSQKVFIAGFTLISVALYLVLIATLIASFLEPILLKPIQSQIHSNV